MRHDASGSRTGGAAAGRRSTGRHRGRPWPSRLPGHQEAAQKVRQQSREQVAALKTRYAEAGTALEQQSQDAAYLAAVDRVQAYQRGFEQVRQTAVPVVAALLVLVLAAAVMVNLRR